METMITCWTNEGATRAIAASELQFRPTAYGVVMHEDSLLVIHDARGRYCFPGGGIEKGETMPTALRREFQEEVGMAVTVGEVLHVQESFFYFNPEHVAWHALLVFFRGEVSQTTSDPTWDAQHPDAERWSWVPLATLREEQFHESLRSAARALRLIP
ncbi:NUDIX domain-containing protein [Candidatus Uhrbacteria bacterium]|nr:NUDIX domain-containing protein [Candidatus Uhrbacteria bacterium]